MAMPRVSLHSLGWSAMAALLAGSALASGPAAAPHAEEASASASSAVVDARRFLLPVGKGATFEIVPRVREDLVEIVIQNTSAQVDALITDKAIFGVREVEVAHPGNHTWFMRLFLDRARTQVEVRKEGHHLSFVVVPGMGSMLEARVPAPSVDQLLRGEMPAPVARNQAPALSFLQGDAMALPLSPFAYLPVLKPDPSWLPPTTWESVDRARSAMIAATTEDAEILARYRLGLHYLEMGLGKEARHYLSGISEAPGPIPQVDLSMAKAHAALACGDWDRAREAYREAALMGAPGPAVVEGLAVVSLATNVPPRAPTGRVLASLTGRPETLLLAVELMQRDGFYAETRPILEAISGRLTGEEGRRAALRLGDARLMDGSLQDARVAWHDADPDIAEVRDILGDLLIGHPATWASNIPVLTQAATERTDAGAEALFLLSQVDLLIGSREDAVGELATLIRRFPRKGASSDLPERFWSVYADHVRTLADMGRWFDIAALHETVWDRSVRRAVQDPAVLLLVAESYEKVGLPERAISVLNDALAVFLVRGVEQPELVLHLAELHEEVGSWKEGLADLDLLGRLRQVPQPILDEGMLLRARLLHGSGEVDAAARVLRDAALRPELRTRATLQLALLDADSGQCARALPTLGRMLSGDDAAERFPDAHAWMSYARCLGARGDARGAAQAARTAAALSPSDTESRYATWIAASAEAWTDPEATLRLAEGDDVWARFAKEQQDAATFEKELERYRKVGM